jgi:ABC-2 type transport system permease protein
MFQWFSFTIALLISTWSILSIGFSHRQHRSHGALCTAIGAIILYPMFAFSGLFVPLAGFSRVRAVSRRVFVKGRVGDNPTKMS